MTELVPSWLLDVVACALCGEGLVEHRRSGERAGVLQCSACRAPYPVIESIAVLVPEPHVWCAVYRDELAECLSDQASLEVALAFASSAPDEPAQPFVDDWLPAEMTGEPWPEPPARFRETFGRFVAEASQTGPARALAAMLGDSIGAVVELGVGAGTLSGPLLERADHLVIADRSMRAVLGVLERYADLHADTPRAGIIVDAEQLPLRAGSIDVLAAANLIDLLDDPDGFLVAATEALAPHGRVALVTPAPDLGDDDAGDDALDDALEAAGLTAVASEDQVPWIRAHRAREWQVYFTRIVVAARPDPRLN